MVYMVHGQNGDKKVLSMLTARLLGGIVTKPSFIVYCDG